MLNYFFSIDAVPPALTHMRGHNLTGPRVLIVDDEFPVGAFLTRVLKAQGCGVRHVATAGEALAVMAAEPADAVVCGVRLPLDSLRLVNQIRMRWPETVIVMSPGDEHASSMTVRRTGIEWRRTADATPAQRVN